MERLDSLYLEYGKLLVQAEVVQGKINAVKGQIVEELNKNGRATPQTTPPADPERKPEDGPK